MPTEKEQKLMKKIVEREFSDSTLPSFSSLSRMIFMSVLACITGFIAAEKINIGFGVFFTITIIFIGVLWGVNKDENAPKIKAL